MGEVAIPVPPLPTLPPTLSPSSLPLPPPPSPTPPDPASSLPPLPSFSTLSQLTRVAEVALDVKVEATASTLSTFAGVRAPGDGEVSHRLLVLGENGVDLQVVG